MRHLWILLFLSPTQLFSQDLSIPKELAPWAEWVLEGHESALCPSPYNDSSKHACAWAGPLVLKISEFGATFSQKWWISADSFIPLPGSQVHWPQNVKIDRRKTAVTWQNGFPSVQLTPGTYQVSGSISWNSIPPYLKLAPVNAWIDLARDEKVIATPNLDSDHRLWFETIESAREQQDAIGLRVFRKYTDTVPAELLTRVEIDVSGKHREETLGPIHPDNFTTVEIDSRLPTYLDEEGLLHLQVRPGNWSVTVRSMSRDHIDRIQLKDATQLWVDEEVWSFDFRPEIRQLSLPAATTIDPSQTLMPVEWKSFQSILCHPSDVIEFLEHARGYAQLEPDQVTIDRTIWLDFDGHGYTIQDRLSGALRQTWRLAVQAPVILGRVSLDGVDQLITTDPEDKTGFEVRQGNLNAVCDSRIESKSRKLPAVAWNTDAVGLNAQLNLPPGWSLIHAFGVDQARGSWIEKWTLYDLFLVLVISFAAGHLFRKRIGFLTCFMLVLTYHVPEAPRWTWVSIFAAIALERALPAGWFKRIVSWWKHLSYALLVLISFIFCIQHIKQGIYPHLSYSGVTQPVQSAYPASPRYEMAEEENFDIVSQQKDGYAEPKRLFSKKVAIDPNALVQTGPGIPAWSWTSVQLSWNGPVSNEENIRLALLSPLALKFLAFLRCGLVLLMGALVMQIRRSQLRVPTSAAVLLLAFFLGSSSSASDVPRQDILDELRTRLLKPDPCYPNCADLPRFEISIQGQTFTWDLSVQTVNRTAIPLPGPQTTWPIRSIKINGDNPIGCIRQDGKTWILLPAGVHEIRVEGILTAQDSAALTFPLTPRLIQARSDSWTAELDDNEEHSQIVFSRQQTQRANDQQRRYDQQVFPSYWSVRRTITLGLDWSVETHVVRLSQGNAGSVVNVPLIEGETVTTAGIKVKDGFVRVNLTPADSSIKWRSSLEPRAAIELLSPIEGTTIDFWHLDASPIWHVESEGIPALHYIDNQGSWQPQWAPWPGETLRLDITRPATSEGVTTTIDASDLTITPGPRSTNFALSFSVKTSRGDRLTVEMPPSSEAPELTIDGTSKPYTLQGETLAVQLPPGASRVGITWRVNEGIRTLYRVPEIKLGNRTINNRTEIDMPNRWTLMTSSGDLGPVVLFWPFLIVLSFFAWLLGKIELTPLKARHWFLLGIGISQISPYAIFFIFAWILFIGAKKHYRDRANNAIYDFGQIALVIVTFFALTLLLEAVRRGLLGSPNMQVSGNGSYASHFRWYTEQCEQVLATPWVFSVSIWFYKIAMLAWSLWMAKSLINWLKWGWSQWVEGGMWRKAAKKLPSIEPSEPQLQPPPLS